MKRSIFIFALCIFTITLTGCGSNNTKVLKENVNKIDLSGNLITYKVYYHNIVEHTKVKDNFLEKDRKLFAEYSATIDLGINLEQVKVSLKDSDTIKVYLPKAKIINGPNISSNDFLPEKFIESSDNFIFKNNIDANDSTNAIKQAQDEIKETVSEDENLMDLARRRAKLILEENIKQLIDLPDKSYIITWEYEG